jgi:hypothetical protein
VNLTITTGNTFSDGQIDELFNQIVEGPKQQNPQMSEATFSSYFLPVLAGVVNDPERLRIYMQGCAGLNVGVDVVDSGNNFLFTVPPIFGTSHIKPMPQDDDAPAFKTIVENVQMLKHRSPSQAEHTLTVGLYQRMIKGTVKNFKPTADEAKWIEIFKRYGYDVSLPVVFLSKENRDSTNKDPQHEPPAGAGSAPANSESFELDGEF